MPTTVGVNIGFCAAELDPSDPAHDHVMALLELALNPTVPPRHNGLVFPGPVDVGAGFTVTVVVYIVAGWQPLPIPLTVSE